MIYLSVQSVFIVSNAIGFIGLGIMGKPMAINLIRSGYTLYVYDISQAALKELEKEGGLVMSSPKAVTENCDMIFSILPDSPQVKEVVYGKEGVLTANVAGKLFIDMSTIDADTEIELNKRFNEAGADSMDAPVSGGQVGAETGNLSIMAGGSKESFEKALPVFNVLGKRINHMGSVGSGQITKSCSQIATALATQGVIEAFALAKSAGVDLSLVREALLGGFAESKALFITGEKIIRQDYSPGFKLRLYSKDLRIAQNAASERSLSLPGTKLLYNEMVELVQAGKGELDFSALIQVLEN